MAVKYSADTVKTLNSRMVVPNIDGCDYSPTKQCPSGTARGWEDTDVVCDRGPGNADGRSHGPGRHRRCTAECQRRRCGPDHRRAGRRRRRNLRGGGRTVFRPRPGLPGPEHPDGRVPPAVRHSPQQRRGLLCGRRGGQRQPAASCRTTTARGDQRAHPSPVGAPPDR